MKEKIAMSKFTPMCVTLGLLCAAMVLWPALAAPESTENVSLRNFPTYWLQDRTAQDDFLPPESGPGPVTGPPNHPYVPNGAGKQQTNRLADLSNPILKPWVVEQMAKTNDAVNEGKVPFIARERCWTTGVPGWLVFAHAAGMWVVQTEKEILLIQELDQQTRHIYMNVPHSEHPKPSWYGESVGHFEGDELVVDTIGMNDKSFVDNYRTPHTDQIHVVERLKIIEGGKTLQVTATVEDPGAYSMAWSAVQRWKRGPQRQILEQICAENSYEFFDYDVVPIPRADKPDF
jgi:hypothetical protein